MYEKYTYVNLMKQCILFQNYDLSQVCTNLFEQVT